MPTENAPLPPHESTGERIAALAMNAADPARAAYLFQLAAKADRLDARAVADVRDIPDEAAR